MFVDFNILNQLGSPSINSNTFANRPAAGQTGRLFVSIDTFEIYRDNGTTWDLIGGPGSSTVTGTGAATQVAYWTAAQAIGGSNNLWWDNTSGFLGVGSNAPSARIEAVKTDGIGIYANYTTNAGSGSSATAIWAKNVTNSSGYGAVIEETTPNATAGQYPLLIKHSLSSGTAGVGMGTGVHWQLPDDAGTFKTTQLTVETINAAAATYATRYRFNVQSNGSSTPVAYLNATGLGIFTATPGAALDIHSTGTIAQLNSTGTTNNGYLAFQRTGATTFSIGDTYNGGSNYFRIFGSALSADIVRIFAATGESFFTSTETYSSGNSIGVAVQHNLTIPNGVNVGLAALGGVNSNLNLSLGGSTTVANTGRQGLEGSTTIGFTGAGTLTMTQGSTVRAFSALSSVYAFNGSAVGTITHLAGLRICFPDNVGSAVNITNNYALLINDQTTGTGTVTYTNRWGIYQEGSSDLNYMAANLLLGSTTNTGEKLQVTGNILATGSATFGATVQTTTTGTNPAFAAVLPANANAEILFSYSNTAFGWKLVQDEAITGDWSIVSRAVNVDTTRIYIKRSDGNVGIGTTNPGSKLDVNGTITTGNTQLISQNLRFTTGIGYIGTATGGGTDLQFYTNDANAMIIKSGGSVGIGTTNPAQLLHLATQLATSSGVGTAIQIESGGSGGDQGWIGVNKGTGNGLEISVENRDIIFNTLATTPFGGSERMRITSGGNVLIGTTTDAGYKLDVNGTLRNTTSAYFATSSGKVGIGNTAPYSKLHTIASGGGDDMGLTIENSGAGGAKFYIWPTASINGEGANKLIFSSATNANILVLNGSTSAASFSGSVTTGTPTGGTSGAWKLGSRVAATVVVNTTEYIEVDIGGTLYKLATVT